MPVIDIVGLIFRILLSRPNLKSDLYKHNDTFFFLKKDNYGGSYLCFQKKNLFFLRTLILSLYE